MGATDVDYACIDVEVTNRCNAGCDFCPRDQTPHEGSMSPAVFDQVLVHTMEFRALAGRHFGTQMTMSFCGLGEATLNRHLPTYIRLAADAGFEPRMCSNGSLLTEERSRALIDAGLREIFINCGDLDDEYDRVYKVPFRRIRDNVVRFIELAGNRCDVHIVLVDHRRDDEYVDRIRNYWRALGVTHFFASPMLNRAGTMEVEGMAFSSYPQYLQAQAVFDELGVEPVCAAAFVFPFIGYDGQYYLCSSDWEKKTPLGSVFDESFFSIFDRKLAHVAGREPICRSCCHDPVNRITATLRDQDLGTPAAGNVKMLSAIFAARTRAVHDLVTASTVLGLSEETTEPGRARRRIPLRAG